MAEFTPFFSHSVNLRQGANLPHWTLPGGTYAIVFRLADSLPESVVEAYRRERNHLLAARLAAGSLMPDDENPLRTLFSERIERFLDAGHGSCWLAQADIAAVVANALRHFDGSRYRLWAWCIMPNHVHAVVQPLGEFSLPEITQSWKGFTAHVINRQLGRHGELWQGEGYDHLLRDTADFVHAVRYIWNNPLQARLKNWQWVWAHHEACRLAELD